MNTPNENTPVHFDALPVGTDFQFVGQPGIYCKVTPERYRAQGGASPVYWITQRHETCRMVIPWHEEELSVLAAQLRGYLEEFLAVPSGTGYCFVRNKIAEYYSVAAARKEEAYAREQERMRKELGIGTGSSKEE